MQKDKPILGIAFMLGFCIIAPIGDAFAKLLGSSVPMTQVVLIRFALQALILIPLVWTTGRLWKMRGRSLALTLLRTLLHILGMVAMFTALRFLPLAETVAIVFVMPFFMLILGHFFLKEEVGPSRILACLVGFAGTLLVIKPSFVNVGWPALLPVFVAANFSVFMLITRQIAKETDPIGLQAVSGIMAVLMMLPLIWLGAWAKLPELAPITPNGQQWLLLGAIGILGTVAHLLMTWSLRYAPSATLAPMQYLEIPFATLLGLLIFRELPDPLAGLGIIITMAAGLFIVQRERASAHAVAQAAQQPAE